MGISQRLLPRHGWLTELERWFPLRWQRRPGRRPRSGTRPDLLGRLFYDLAALSGAHRPRGQRRLASGLPHPRSRHGGRHSCVHVPLLWLVIPHPAARSAPPGGGCKDGSRWKVHKVLLGVSLNASIFGAIVFEAFSAHYPKRVLMLHARTRLPQMARALLTGPGRAGARM